jgi:hypothetical protein
MAYMDLSHRQISHKYKCIFIHIPKSAGTSIETSPIFFDSKETTGKAPAGHTSCLQFQNLFPNEFKEYFKFSFVRNPWDRLVSAYFHYRQNILNYGDKKNYEKYLYKYDSFDEFIRKFVNEDNIYKIIHLKPQYEFLCDCNNNIMVDFVGRVENIEKDFKIICKKIGVIYKLKNKRKTRHGHYSNFYVKDTMKIVERVYKKDIEFFGYKFQTKRFRRLNYYLRYVPDEGLKLAKKMIKKMLKSNM